METKRPTAPPERSVPGTGTAAPRREDGPLGTPDRPAHAGEHRERLRILAELEVLLERNPFVDDSAFR